MNQRISFPLAIMVVMTLAVAQAGMAQQITPPPKAEANYYRLDFSLTEKEDSKPVNTRNYSMWLMPGSKPGGSIRAGNEVPYVSLLAGDKPAGVSYRDIGIYLDCFIYEIDGLVQLNFNGKISGVVSPEQGQDARLPIPVFRNITMNATVLLTQGKAMPISMIDDPASRRRYTLEVIATKLK